MPLYLARWPDLSCALVKAHSRAELLDILDELDNPEGVEIQPYDGPLFLDFTLATDRPLPVRDGVSRKAGEPLSERDIEIGDVRDLAAGAFPEVQIPETETGIAMYEALLEGAFPHLYRALVTDRDIDEETADVERVKAATREEAMVLVRASWRLAAIARSDDPVAIIAAQLGTSIENVRDLQRQVDKDWE